MVATLPELEDDEPILFFYASDGRDEGDSAVGALWDDAETVRRRYLRRYGCDPSTSWQ